MNYEKCGVCGGWGDPRWHRCPPIWECIAEEDRCEGDWSRVYASDAGEAAELFFEAADIYDHLDQDHMVVLVRPLKGPAVEERFDVAREHQPSYYASALD